MHHYYLVFTRPKAGQEDEYNHWYSKIHIFDLVAIPGVVAARRYTLTDRSKKDAGGNYLAVYELSDIDLAIAGIAERRGTDRMPSSDAIDRDASRGIIFQPLWDGAAHWQFDRGALDLVSVKQPEKIALPAHAAGYFRAADKQSRPGTPIFNHARFSADGYSDVRAPGFADFGPADRIGASLSVLMDPITERATAKGSVL